MPDWLTTAAREHGDKLAYLAGRDESDYALLDRHVNGLARALLPYVRPGERLAVQLPNRSETVILIHAVARLGGTLVPLNTRLTPQEAAAQQEQALAASIVTLDSGNRLLLTRGTEKFRLPLPTDRQDTRPLDDVPPFDLDRLQAIVFTSGTSGTPKGARLTFGNHWHSAQASADRLGVQPDDCWLSPIPLYHVGGLAVVFRSAIYGTTAILHDGFDPEAVWQSMKHQRATIISLVPTMLYRLLEHRPGQPFPPSIRVVLVGGAAADKRLMRRALDLGIPIAATYGLTEAASQVATATPDETRRKPASVGRPLSGSQVRIADENGLSLPAGEIGEIGVRSPTVMDGYDNAPNDRALREGWLHTGDLGYLDADGDLFVVQRRTDLILSGGENIYPAEVEAVLKAMDSVTDAIVFALPSEEWGQIVAAAIMQAPDTVVTREQIDEECRARLAAYKRPRAVFFVDLFPLTASGKVNRRALAEMFTPLT